MTPILWSYELFVCSFIALCVFSLLGFSIFMISFSLRLNYIAKNHTTNFFTKVPVVQRIIPQKVTNPEERLFFRKYSDARRFKYALCTT